MYIYNIAMVVYVVSRRVKQDAPFQPTAAAGGFATACTRKGGTDAPRRAPSDCRCLRFADATSRRWSRSRLSYTMIQSAVHELY